MPKKTCDICGANMKADCHAHAQYCPLSCEYKEPENPPVNNSLPIGDAYPFLFIVIVIYLFIKRFKQ